MFSEGEVLRDPKPFLEILADMVAPLNKGVEFIIEFDSVKAIFAQLE